MQKVLHESVICCYPVTIGIRTLGAEFEVSEADKFFGKLFRRFSLVLLLCCLPITSESCNISVYRRGVQALCGEGSLKCLL